MSSETSVRSFCTRQQFWGCQISQRKASVRKVRMGSANVGAGVRMDKPDSILMCLALQNEEMCGVQKPEDCGVRTFVMFKVPILTCRVFFLDIIPVWRLLVCPQVHGMLSAKRFASMDLLRWSASTIAGVIFSSFLLQYSPLLAWSLWELLWMNLRCSAFGTQKQAPWAKTQNTLPDARHVNSHLIILRNLLLDQMLTAEQCSLLRARGCD